MVTFEDEWNSGCGNGRICKRLKGQCGGRCWWLSETERRMAKGEEMDKNERGIVMQRGVGMDGWHS
jgi:hypothetical protein